LTEIRVTKTVLVVDDEPNLLRLIDMNLRMAGLNVVTAGDGVEALKQVEAHYPDLILMDVMMPHMDGFETLRRLKSDPLNRDIPVIMLTVRSRDQDILQSVEMGAEFYINKPFDPTELKEFILRFLAGENPTPPQ
jgi:CheY-like chemotaxis protein